MALFQAFDISASGMTAQRFRTDIIAENVANVNTTRTEDGTPYRRKIVTFAEKDLNSFGNMLAKTSRRIYGGDGVKVTKVAEDDTTDFIMKYDPDADADGYVSYPNVNIVTEMTNLIDASRGYESNVTAFNATKAMAEAGLQVGKQ